MQCSLGMPELPDVETFRRYLVATSLDRPIGRVRVEDTRVLAEVTPRTLDRRLEGRSLSHAERHGKVLFARAGSEWVSFRFGMTGFLRYYRRPEEAGEHERVRFDFRDGNHLAFDCQRMFGRVGLTPDPDAFIGEHRLGPDARTIARDRFAQRIGGHRGSIKSALMDQSALAGIGNVYSDEILYQARLHPRSEARSLGRRGLGDLHRTMKRVLERAIEAEAQPQRMPRGWLTPSRRKDAHCPRCGTPLETETAGGRSAYLCPYCQAAGA